MAATNKHGQTCEQTCGTMARSGFHSALCHTAEALLTTGDMAMKTITTILENTLSEMETFEGILRTARRNAEEAATAADSAAEELRSTESQLEDLMSTLREAIDEATTTDDSGKEFRDNVRARVARLQGDAQAMVNTATEALEFIDSNGDRSITEG